MPVDEFFAYRSEDLPSRIRRLEDWAATYAGRATNDPAVKQSVASSAAPSGGSGSSGGGTATTSQVPGPFGVGGPASDGDFEVFGDAYTLFTHSDASTGSNTNGVVLDRGDAASTVALGFEWRQAGVLQWSLRMAPSTQAIQLYDTLNAQTLFSADFSVASRLSFFGATPAAQAAQTVDMRTVLINFGLMASASGATPLSLNGGNFDANQATLSAGIRGSGGAISLGTATVTFTADADQALSASEMVNAHIIIAAGAHPIAPQNLTTPTTTGGIYFVQNLNAQTITFKTAAGTGVAIPTGGILHCRVGANIVSLKPTV